MIGSDTVVAEAYEQLRHHRLAALPGSAHFGLAVLLREGMAAWIERCARKAASQSWTMSNPSFTSIVTPPLQSGIVQILASIALSRTQEIPR